MSRTRLVGAALLFLAFLPGCRTSPCDNRTLCDRWHDFWRGDRYEAMPVSYPMMEGGCQGGCATPIPGGMMPMPGGMPFQGAPIYMGGPGVSGPMGTDTLPPPPGVQTMPPRIPKAGIDEGKGKQFELEGAGRTGPAGPALPVGSIK
jgi:hypothetical protein